MSHTFKTSHIVVRIKNYEIMKTQTLIYHSKCVIKKLKQGIADDVVKSRASISIWCYMYAVYAMLYTDVRLGMSQA